MSGSLAEPHAKEDLPGDGLVFFNDSNFAFTLDSSSPVSGGASPSTERPFTQQILQHTSSVFFNLKISFQSRVRTTSWRCQSKYFAMTVTDFVRSKITQEQATRAALQGKRGRKKKKKGSSPSKRQRKKERRKKKGAQLGKSIPTAAAIASPAFTRSFRSALVVARLCSRPTRTCST